MSESKIKVAVKMRPRIKREMDKKIPACWQIDGNSLYDTGGNYEAGFPFDLIFGEESNTDEVYEQVAGPIVSKAIKGMNGTIFAYGQTCSGKTYTMMGDENKDGLVLMAIKHIFNEVQNSDVEFVLRAGYIEIYNEKIFDLFEPENVDLKISERNNDVQVNFKEKICKSVEDMYNVILVGNKNKKIGGTDMNERSSRSHTIFHIKIESIEAGTEMVKISSLNLVDLAGSERASQANTKGDRFVEGCHINKSLLSISLVINKLAKNDGSHINYRDSKLTRYLQSSLGGNALAAIICTVTPCALEETAYTLFFAQRAMKVTNKPRVNKIVSDATVIKQLHKTIRELTDQLEEVKAKNETTSSIPRLLKELSQKKDVILNYRKSLPNDGKNVWRRRTWGFDSELDVISETAPFPLQTEQASSLINFQQELTPTVTIRDTKLNGHEFYHMIDRQSLDEEFDYKSKYEQLLVDYEELQDFTNLEKECGSGLDKLTACIAQLEDLEKERETLKKRCDELEQENITQDCTHEQYRKKAERRERELVSVVEEINHNANVNLMVEQNKVIDSLKEQIAQMIAESESKKSEADDLEQRIRQLASVGVEVEELKETINKLNNYIGVLETEKNDLSMRLNESTMQGTLAQIDCSVAAVPEVVAVAVDKNLQAEYDELSIRVMDLVQETEDQQKRIGDLEEQLKRAKLEEESASEPTEDYQEENRKLMEEIEAKINLIGLQSEQLKAIEEKMEILRVSNETLESNIQAQMQYFDSEKIILEEQFGKERDNWMVEKERYLSELEVNRVAKEGLEQERSSLEDEFKRERENWTTERDRYLLEIDAIRVAKDSMEEERANQEEEFKQAQESWATEKERYLSEMESNSAVAQEKWDAERLNVEAAFEKERECWSIERERYETDLEAIKQTKEALDRERINLEAEFKKERENWETDSERIVTEMDTLRLCREKLDAERIAMEEKFNKELTELIADKNRYQSELDSLRGQLVAEKALAEDHLSKERASWTEEKGRYLAELESIRVASVKVENGDEQLEREREKWSLERERFQSELNSIRVANEKLDAERLDIEQELCKQKQDWTVERERLLSEFDTLQAKNIALVNDIELQLQKVHTLNAEKKAMACTIDELDSQVQAKEAEMGQVGQLQEEMARHLRRIAELENAQVDHNGMHHDELAQLVASKAALVTELDTTVCQMHVLNKQISDLKCEIHILTDDINDKVAEMKEWQEKVEAREVTIGDLNRRLLGNEVDLATREAELKEKNNKIVDLLAQLQHIEKLDAEREEILANVNAKLKDVTEKMLVLESHGNSDDQLSAEKDKLTAELAEVKAQMQALEDQFNANGEQLRQAEEEKMEAHKTLQEVQQEVVELQRQKQNEEQLRCDVEGERSRMDQELKSTLQRIIQLEADLQQVEHLQAENDRLTNELATESKAKCDLENELKGTRTQVDTLAKQVNHIESQLSAATSSTKLLKGQLEAMEEQKQRLEKELETVRSQMKSLQEAAATAPQQLVEHQQKLAAAEQAIVELEAAQVKKNEKFESELLQKVQTIDGLHSEVRRLKAEAGGGSSSSGVANQIQRGRARRSSTFDQNRRLYDETFGTKDAQMMTDPVSQLCNCVELGEKVRKLQATITLKEMQMTEMREGQKRSPMMLENYNLKKMVSDLTQKNGDLVRNYEFAQEKVLGLQSQMYRVTEQLGETNQTLSRKAVILEDTKKLCKSQLDQIKELEAALSNVKENIPEDDNESEMKKKYKLIKKVMEKRYQRIADLTAEINEIKTQRTCIQCHGALREVE